ncbi:transposase [Prevotella sp. E15-22]|uniref:transposase n=1 Tax=Prevotella sp. E15-22 TaxID=2937774 RepID=UPI00206C990B|nr:transposase [Prevotella sp. E15-22]UPS45213.1 transposase [Prevotella sp. E15-22]
MLRRSDTHDYTGKCFYLVTMTVEGRRPLLGVLTGRVEARPGAADAPAVDLSPLGQAVSEAWEAISSHYPQVAVIAQQVMPDHFHGILFFRESTDGLHLGHVIRGFKAATNRAYRELFPSSCAASIGVPRPSSCAATLSQPTIEGRKGPGLLWSKGYNDRILYNYYQLDRWKAYLRDNPRRLLVKHQHPEFFRVQRNLQYAELSFSAIGNRFLLDYPVKLQVQCSRRLTLEALEQKKADLLSAAAQGAVLVSPAISPGEKAIMRAAFDAGYPLIILQENGFTDLAKPGGARFDACARGQLLLLAPWEHHNERLVIRRDQCLQLNEMARRICE